MGETPFAKRIFLLGADNNLPLADMAQREDDAYARVKKGERRGEARASKAQPMPSAGSDSHLAPYINTLKYWSRCVEAEGCRGCCEEEEKVSLFAGKHSREITRSFRSQEEEARPQRG